MEKADVTNLVKTAWDKLNENQDLGLISVDSVKLLSAILQISEEIQLAPISDPEWLELAKAIFYWGSKQFVQFDKQTNKLFDLLRKMGKEGRLGSKLPGSPQDKAELARRKLLGFLSNALSLRKEALTLMGMTPNKQSQEEIKTYSKAILEKARDEKKRITANGISGYPAFEVQFVQGVFRSYRRRNLCGALKNFQEVIDAPDHQVFFTQKIEALFWKGLLESDLGFPLEALKSFESAINLYALRPEPSEWSESLFFRIQVHRIRCKLDSWDGRAESEGLLSLIHI